MGIPWKQIFTLGLNIGSQVAAASVPGLGAVAMIPQIVSNVEQAFSTPSSGDAKKAAALQATIVAISIAEGITQKDLINNDAAMAAIDRLIDDSVALENAIHWKK
jgi:hypothetical protein